jgi:probable phosphoglycerate mutase
MGELWLARHGETEWSRTGQHTGRTDLPLTPAGEARARALGEALGGRRFARVLTSPLRRARDTCALAGYGAVAELEPELVEWDYGDYEGLRLEEIRARAPGWTIWTGGVPGGESAAQVAARAARVIARALAVGPGDGDALLFGHGHALRVLATVWAGWPVEAGRALALDTATVSVLGTDAHGERVIRLWNGTPPAPPG